MALSTNRKLVIMILVVGCNKLEVIFVENTENFFFKSKTQKYSQALKHTIHIIDNTKSYEGPEIEDQDPCEQPKGETGIFRGKQELWTFDKEKGACVQFVYGGVGGSENKFKSKGDCEKQCLSS